MVVLSYKLFSAHHLTPYAWDIMVIYFKVIWQEVQSGILLKSGTICRDRLVSGRGIVQFKSEQTTTTPLRSYLWYEPPRDKTNKMACATSEDSDQPGHPPSLVRVFAVRMKKASVLSYPLNAQRRLWSDWADAQADLSVRWAHMSFCWFCHEAAHHDRKTRNTNGVSRVLLTCDIIGVTPRENLSSDIGDQARLQPACSANASYSIKISDIHDAQADLCLCCSHMK